MPDDRNPILRSSTVNRDPAHADHTTDPATPRPYRAPRLLVYGAMRELTAGGTTGEPEGASKAGNKVMS